MLILANREAEYFCEDDWTGFCAACPSGKSPLAPFLFELKALGKASCRRAIRMYYPTDSVSFWRKAEVRQKTKVS